MRRAATASLVLAAALLAPGCANPPAEPARAAAPAAATATAPATAAAPTRTVALRNAGFEESLRGGRCPQGWDCTMHNNPDAFRFSLDEGAAPQGRRSACIERVADEPWALITQVPQPPLRGARLRFSIAVRAQGLAGGAGPWVLVQAAPPVNRNRLAKATRGWERLAVEFDVPANAQVIEVGATLEGPGRACFDDARLEVLDGPQGPR